MPAMTIPDMTAELDQKIAELNQKNVTVFERYTTEDIQRAMERAGQFLEAFRSDSNGRTDVTTEELQPLAKMLAMYDLRMLEQMFESTEGEL